MHLFDEIAWKDPVSGVPLIPRIAARDPVGRPLAGALVIEGTETGYPIVHGLPRLTPELALRHKNWLVAMDLFPPSISSEATTQSEDTVESFGYQWLWDSEPRTEVDLRWRVAERHGLTAAHYAGKFVLDAGAGAGDQSRWILNNGARAVVSIDLSQAIEVAYRKLENVPNWIGVQGDITTLPFGDEIFGFVYCEGVIQHTRDSEKTVAELLRMVAPGGHGLATHYSIPDSLKLRAQLRLRNAIRSRLSRIGKDQLLLTSGILAAFAQIPLIGNVIGKTVAVKNMRMPTFKATWSATYDTYGSHTFQRHLSPTDFLEYFDVGGITASPSAGGGVLFAKLPTMQSQLETGAK